MTDPTQRPAGATPPASQPPRTFWQRFGRWVTIAAGVVITVVAIFRLIGTFTLPGCDSSRMADTLRGIYRDQKVQFKDISDIKTVSSSSSDIACTAQIEVAGERETIDYRTFWEGWTARVAVSSSLPFCEANRAGITIRNIYKERKVDIDKVYNLKTVTSSDSERTCTARITAPGEEADITFRIFRKEGTTQILITEVRSPPK